VNGFSKASHRVRVLAAIALVAPALLSGVTLTASSKAPDFISRWRGEMPIAIDGVNQEWQGLLAPMKDTRVSIGFYNDDQYLYFCLTTGDRATRSQILRQGLIVWIDQRGGKKKNFGIEFPVGLPGMFVVDRAGDTGEARAVPARPLEANQDRLVILGPGKNDRQDLAFDEAPGIQAKIGESTGVLVYEMRVPLAKSDGQPYAIGARPNTVVGVGLETPEFNRSAMRPPIGGGGGGGARSGICRCRRLRFQAFPRRDRSR